MHQLRDRSLGGLLVGLAVLFGCGDDTTPPPPSDGGRDSGRDGGTDAFVPPDGDGIDVFVPDAGPPGTVIAEDVCDAADAVAVDSDGSHAAVVTCGAAPMVRIVEIDSGTATDLGPAMAGWSVAFSPDDAWVLYGGGGTFHVRAADASADAVTIATDTVLGWRFVTVGDELRLLVLEANGTRRILLRRDTDGFVGVEMLAEDPTLEGDLSLISSSGETLVFRLGSTLYQKVPTDASAAPIGLAFNPADYVLAPIGLGNTHGIAHDGAEGLAFVALETTDVVEIAADGVQPDTPLFVLTDPVDGAYAYFVRNGDPSRQLRNGTGTLQTLATANATHLLPVPDGTRIVFHDTGILYAGSNDGSGTLLRVMTTSLMAAPDELEVVIDPEATQIAARIGGGRISRAPLDAADDDVVIEDAATVPGSLGYTTDGDRLVWIRGSDLRVAGTDSEASTVTPEVTHWWSRRASEILFRSSEGSLRRLDT